MSLEFFEVPESLLTKVGHGRGIEFIKQELASSAPSPSAKAKTVTLQFKKP
jgi:hypothetical protein